MNFFSSAVEILEAVMDALNDLAENARARADMAAFIRKRTARKASYFAKSQGISMVMAGGGGRPPPKHKNMITLKRKMFWGL